MRQNQLNPRFRERITALGLNWPRGLTDRHLQVLEWIAQSKKNTAMAIDMGVCKNTLEKHRTALMNGLNIHDVAALTRYAIHIGLVPADWGLKKHV